MQIKSFIKFIAITNFIAALATAAIAVYLHRSSPRELVDLSTMVGFGIGIMGALIAKGAKTGDGPVQSNMTTSVAGSPNATRYADYLDMVAGLSFGTLMIISAVIWIILSACLYQAIV
ncbi:MAG: hypothetical protein JO142_09185 [Burkholderiales bacterium]|nr:hypothetical protein [Burkholderiales bacterium]